MTTELPHGIRIDVVSPGWLAKSTGTVITGPDRT